MVVHVLEGLADLVEGRPAVPVTCIQVSIEYTRLSIFGSTKSSW